MTKSSLINFQRDDAGWSEADNEKARAMIRRTRGDGTRRYSNDDIARFLGMALSYIEKLERRPNGSRSRTRKKKAPK